MDYVEMLFVKMSSEAVIPTRTTEHSVGQISIVHQTI